MGHAIEFVETSLFTRSIQQIATDDELRALQNDLVANPTKGDLSTGGLRKVRMAVRGQGKSGSARVIYLLATAETIYLVLAYAKGEKESLTQGEKASLKQLTQQLKGES